MKDPVECRLNDQSDRDEPGCFECQKQCLQSADRVAAEKAVHGLKNTGAGDETEDPACEEDRDRRFDPDGQIEGEKRRGQCAEKGGKRAVKAKGTANTENKPGQSGCETAPDQMSGLRVEENDKGDAGDKGA